MKITKQILEKYIRQVMNEAFQQKLFGGEEEISVDGAKEPWREIEPMARQTNLEFGKAYGMPLIRKFYRLHRNYETSEPVPKIQQIIPMDNGVIEIVFEDGKQEVYVPYGSKAGMRY